ncbi:NAD(P)H-binding protein [Nocardioides zeae]|uniref:NAD(P)H-binding protein n=1 Tax=Nocardioides imazamoxiresistens TaxID=3231893 RepID=A0ABU3PW19_9ACTN|nr:NAD(P)H-binding protein [Nocardioides zeae]MDT9593401.1 NAD(P)H-binding protein [Nocardioides zeae]
MPDDSGTPTTAPTRVLVTGASGFVGHRLVPALLQQGHDVRAMTRHPDTYDGLGTPVYGDVSDPGSLAEPLTDVDVAYYFVHSLDDDDFEAKDAAAARAFGQAAAALGVRQIIYLGGLGADDEDLSPHLRSRREVERLLGESGVPVTVLRAAVVIGHGGISWEITRQLVQRLPAMVAPKWAKTRTQPIAVDDVVRYLVGVLDREEALDRVFEIGGPDQLDYLGMLREAARVQKGHAPPILPVPILSPRLSSHWLSFVTDVDTTTGRNLIDSMDVEVLVTDHSIRDLVPGEPLSYAEAVRRALAEREAEEARDRARRAERADRAERPDAEPSEA